MLYNCKSITILYSKQNCAFFKIKKQEKEAGTNFILLSLSRNMIGLFMENYLNSSMNSESQIFVCNINLPFYVYDTFIIL